MVKEVVEKEGSGAETYVEDVDFDDLTEGLASREEN